MVQEVVSHARAGLVGNPSDGYFGKTLSFTMENYWARLEMWESKRIQFLPSPQDDSSFDGPDKLLKDIQLYGYYGGIRLLKATTKVFLEYCREHGLSLPPRNFSVCYDSNIPRLVGMAGSSAICTAMFKSLMRFYEVQIPRPVIPTLCLNAEIKELGIQAGLQDRVVQIYGGLVYMDFDRELVTGRGYGEYCHVDPRLLPPLYVAFDPMRAEVSGNYHSKLKVLFDSNDQSVHQAMREFGSYAQAAYDALLAGHPERLPALINANFDLRDRIFNVAEANRRMVHTARRSGASAKFCGSGGAIVGTYEDEAQYRRLAELLAEIGCVTFQPLIPHVLS